MVLDCIDTKKGQYPDIDIEIWTQPNLLEIFSELTVYAKQQMFGFVPTMDTMRSITLEDLEPVITSLESREPDIDDDMLAPPSELKLEKNALSKYARELLKVGRLKVRMVDFYFSRGVNVELGERIAEAFRQRYAQLSASDLTPDEILGGLQEFAGVSGEPKRQAAAMSVLMYFFDRCDIFEDPDEGDVVEP